VMEFSRKGTPSIREVMVDDLKRLRGKLLRKYSNLFEEGTK